MRTKTIDELVEDALTLCREQGFTEASIYAKHKVFKAIIRKHKENGCDTYNADLLAEYTLAQKDSYEHGGLKRDSYNFKVKTALQLKELAETGTIDYGCVNRSTGMTDYYSGIIDRMLSFPEWDGKYAHGIRRYAMPFFKWLAGNQILLMMKPC